MNEKRYKKGLPEIKWKNKVCTDIQEDMVVGGIEAMEKKTPGSSDYKKTKTLTISAEDDAEGVAEVLGDGGDTTPLVGDTDILESKVAVEPVDEAVGEPVGEAEGEPVDEPVEAEVGVGVGDVRKLKAKKKSPSKKKKSPSKKKK